MKKFPIAACSASLAALMCLTSCESTTGTGALTGAAGGAALGALLGHGRAENIAAGAILGAGTGALVGHMVGHADERRYYNNRELPYGRSLGHGLVQSPYRPYNTIDTRGIPRGAVVEDPSTGRYFIKP